jgi:hypothetical protein
MSHDRVQQAYLAGATAGHPRRAQIVIGWPHQTLAAMIT